MERRSRHCLKKKKTSQRFVIFPLKKIRPKLSLGVWPPFDWSVSPVSCVVIFYFLGEIVHSVDFS